MAMSRKKCCVPGCLESHSSHKTMHLFPNPAKERQRFNQWVLAIGGDIIGLENDDIYKHRSVCHAHFEEKFCCRFNRISNIAVPTLNLPGPLSIPKFTFGERRPMKSIQNRSMPSTSASASSSTSLFEGLQMVSPIVTLAANTKPQNEPTMKENIDPITTHLIEVKKPAEETTEKNQLAPASSFKKDIESHKKTAKVCVKKTVNKCLQVTAEEQKLYRKLIQTRIKLSKCRHIVKRQSASLKAAKNIMSNPALVATMDKLPSTAKILTMMQLRQVKKKKKGRRFSLQEKIVALSIFKRSPKCYRFLRQMLILPAPQTLANLVSQADIKPGMNKKIFSQLKGVTEKMSPQEKLCVLLFDEMFLKANISYNERKDRVIGFTTDGEQTKQEFADHAQVFMVRGLIKNYKQPISYTFSAAATSGQEIAKQIKQIVTELQEAGLVVVATICDQGTNNRQAIKLLIQETRGTYLRAGQEPKENVILINNLEVVPLYDPPHLLKCIRNNLLTKNLQYHENGKTCTAKWQHLIMLHHENPGYKGVRLIPKLTENHVIPEKISKNKMKVKFASQIFSRTVATNMGYLADKEILPKECMETADILLFFDNLFDSQNGSYNKRKEKFAKPLLGPVTPKSDHHKEWADAKKKLKTMKFVHPISGKVEIVPTLQNWVWTLEGLQYLLKKLEKEHDVTSVWMRHLNQDPIENFFGAIRSHGCRNTNPTPEKFESAFTSLLINNISSVHAPIGANCEEDFGTNLHALIVTGDCKAKMTCDLEFIPNITIDEMITKNDPRIMGPLQYVSGYFIKKAKKKVFKNCKNCKKSMIAIEGNEYIKYREYAGRQWLCSPTDAVLISISAVQDVTYSIIKECLEKNNIKELIKTCIIMFVEFDYIDCEKHKDDVINFLINTALKFFLYNYCKDVNKILVGKLDCCDEDKFKLKAKKYFKKCYKRPIK